MDVGLDSFCGIVLTGGNLLQSCGVDDIVDTLKCSGQTLFVSYIADEETKLVRLLLKFVLHN